MPTVVPSAKRSQLGLADARSNERGAFLLAWVATKGVVLLLPGASQLSVGQLPTEDFSHNEDEYCSAKAPAQEQIQQGIACCG